MPYFEIILVAVVIVFILTALYFEFIGAGFAFLIGVTVLTVFNVITPQEMLIGVANEQIAVIILLILIGNIFRDTSVLDIFFNWIFKSARTYKGFMARIMFIVAPLSAFMNNTPLVAILIPYAHNWAKKNKAAISKLLIPLSFAAILGGCVTLIGTSTHLIVNGLVIDQDIFPDLPELEIFDFAFVGIPMMIIGFIYMLFVGHRLLPNRQGINEQFKKHTRKYIVEAQIIKNSKIIGKTIEEANLRNLEGLYLFQIIRGEDVMNAVPHDAVLFENDILLFAGDTTAIAELLESNLSLHIPSVGMFARKKNTDIIEIVIADNSTMCNKTLKSENFRANYDATVIALRRNDERISGKLGEVRLKAGDAVLLLAGEHFSEPAETTRNFYVISKVKEIRKIGTFKTILLVGGLILTILLASIGIIKLFIGLVILLSLLLIFKVTTPRKLTKSIDYDLALIIAMALALGVAMLKTGFAEIIAVFIIKIFIPLGNVGLLAGIYLITTLLAAFITSRASVAVIFPISLTMAKDLDLPPLPFILVVSLAAAANFMTPIGYQTNTMVYGPGSYKFKDFLKVGTPLTIIYGIVTVLILSLMYL